MHFNKQCTVFIALFIPLVAGTAFAEEEAAPTGFHGDFAIGGSWSSTDSQLVIPLGGKIRTITSLSDGDQQSQWFPLVTGSLNYSTDTGTSIFLTSQGDLAVGLSQNLPGFGTAIVAGTFQLEEVYKDPYLTEVKRDDTNELRLGGKFRVEDILGTGLCLGYKYDHVDVNDDLVGRRDPLLERDGATHNIDGSGSLEFNKHNSLTAVLQYELGDFEGKSNSYDSFGANITYTFMNDDVVLENTISASQAEYDHRHPIFNKTREDETYGVSTSMTWLNPFGYKDYFINLSGSYSATDSNISFFDSHDTSTFSSTV